MESLRRFNLWRKYWGVVQLAARLTLDQKVLGSSPSTPASRPVNPAFFMGAFNAEKSRFFPGDVDEFAFAKCQEFYLKEPVPRGKSLQ